MKSTRGKLLDALQQAEAAVLSGSILGIAGLAIANVLARTATNLVGWEGLAACQAVAGEVSQFLIIIVTFVGLSYAAGLGRHIRMTALTDQLPAGARACLERGVRAATALLLLVFAAYACRYVYAVYELGGVFSVTRTPFYLVYSAAPLGFALAGLKYGLLCLVDPAPDAVGEATGGAAD